MYMDSEKFENWMERIMERFDRTEKLLERVLKKSNALDGEEVLDNQDLCLLLKVGIRTLQRYRAIGIFLGGGNFPLSLNDKNSVNIKIQI